MGKNTHSVPNTFVLISVAHFLVFIQNPGVVNEVANVHPNQMALQPPLNHVQRAIDLGQLQDTQ